MLIGYVIEFKLRGPESPDRAYTPKLVIFVINQTFIKDNFRVDYYLLLKYCSMQCILLSLTWAKSLAKFNTKMQAFERVLNLNCK